jgi:hypothetical protein
MANPGLSYHLPITPVSTISGNQEQTNNYQEAAGQSFQPGTVVQLSTSGPSQYYVIGSTPSNGSTQLVALGVTALKGKNLGTNGAGASPLYGQIGYPGGAGAVQDVVNQPNAYSIYHGAPFLDGLTLVYQANLDTIFEVQVDASSGGTYNATINLIGSTIALAKDGNGWWYADLHEVNAGSYNDVVVVGINPLDLVAGSTTTQQNYGRIRVQFTSATIQVAN